MSESTLQLLTCWELVGLCSFALIGHWWEEKPNSDAALKAFITNRVGDVGLICGVIILFFAAGQTFDILDDQRDGGDRRDQPPGAARRRRARCSPRSCRSRASSSSTPGCPTPWPAPRPCRPSSTPPPWSWPASSWSPASTACSSRACRSAPRAQPAGGRRRRHRARRRRPRLRAERHQEGARLLHGRQLGYMVMALGVGAWTAAMFHLFTHALFKAGLFLGSGSVAHAVHSFDMKADMGGMRRFMPKTFVHLHRSAPLALIGIFPLGRLLVEGRDPRRRRRSSAARRLHGLPRRRAPRRLHDRRVHDPLHLPHVLRRAPGPRRRHAPPAARVRARGSSCRSTSSAALAVVAGFVNIPNTGALTSSPTALALRFEHYFEPKGDVLPARARDLQPPRVQHRDRAHLDRHRR